MPGPRKCAHCRAGEIDYTADYLVSGKDRDGKRRTDWPICSDHLHMELEDGAEFPRPRKLSEVPA